MAMAPQGRPKARFVEGSLLRHVTVMSLTASVGLMAVFAVDLINLVFISMLGRPELTAAVGYASAILFFTTSVGIGLSIAAAALVSRAVGSGDGEGARRLATSAVILSVVVGIAFAAGVWGLIPAMSRLIGAQGETLDLTIHYLRIVVPSMPLLIVGMVGGAILRSHGDARRSMYATIGGALVNAALDPILIFGLGLELTGAAIATVISRLAIGLLALLPIIRHHGGFVRPNGAMLRIDGLPLLAIAAPGILTQLAPPLGQAWVTRAMAAYGEEAVAGLAIVSRLIPVAFGVLFALSGAIGPIIGQNLGAGRFDRVRGAVREGIVFCAIVIAAVSAALWVARPGLDVLFGLTGQAREIVHLFAGPLSLLFFFNGVIFVANAACNNLGAPFQSTWVNWGRHTIGTVPFVMVGAAWWGAGGVLIGQAVGGVAFGLLALWLAAGTIRRAEARATPAAPPAADPLPLA